MQTPQARIASRFALFVFIVGCGGETATEATDGTSGGETAQVSPIDERDVLGAEIPRPASAGAPTSEGSAVFQALSYRAIRTVHVLPGTHLAFVENYDDTSSLLDLETGHVRAMRRLAFEGEVEARLVVDRTGAFAAVGVMPLRGSGRTSGPVYLWDLAADRTHVARRALSVAPDAEGNAPTPFEGRALAIAPGGTEIALFEQATGVIFGGPNRDDSKPARLVRIDPFASTERAIELRGVPVTAADAIAYSGPRNRAVVIAQGGETDGALSFSTRIVRTDGIVTTIDDVAGETLVRPNGGQMLVRTATAWEARNPSDGAVLATLPVPQTARLAYSSTGDCIVAHVDETKFVFIDPATMQQKAELGAEGVLGLDALGACERAVTLGRDRSLVIVDLREGGEPARRVDAASFAWTDESLEPARVGLTSTHDGRYAVSWDGDSILTYDITAGTATGMRTLGYAPSIWAVSWSARGDALLAQTRESSFVIDGTNALTGNMDCGLGYVVRASANGAFVVEEGRNPRCALGTDLVAPDDEGAICYDDAGTSLVTLGARDVGLHRADTARKKLATRADLGCTGDAECAVQGVFSRDGALLALEANGRVLVVDVRRARIVARHTVPASAHAVTFSATGTEVLAISDGAFARLPVRGGAATTVALPTGSVVPESSHVERYVVVEADGVRLVSLAGGADVTHAVEGVRSLELVSQTDPFLFHAFADQGDLVIDAQLGRVRTLRGALLGAGRQGDAMIVAECVDGDIRVSRTDSAGAELSQSSLGDCTGVRQVAIAPDGVTVAMVRGALIELRRLDGTGAPAFVELLETAETGYVLANSAGRFYATDASRPFIRYRSPGDARTAPMTDGIVDTGFDAHLLDGFFGRAAQP